MYFTDRGIEELAERRGSEEISLGWLAERLREFVDAAPRHILLELNAEVLRC